MAHVEDTVCEPNCLRSIAGRTPIYQGDSYLIDTRKSQRERRREKEPERERETGERRCRQHQDIQLRMRLAGKNEEKVEAGFLHILFKLLC